MEPGVLCADADELWHPGGGMAAAAVPVRFSSVARQPVEDVGEVHARRAHLLQLLAVGGDGVGEVDDVEDLGSTELGDLHGSHARKAKGAQRRA